MFWSMHTGIIAAGSVVLARYVGYFFPLDDRATRLVAIAAITLLSAINYIGVRHGSGLQVIVTAAKIAGIAVVIALAWVLGSPPASHTVVEIPGPWLREFFLAVSAALFTFGGWHMVTYAAEETRSPERTIPRALVIGTMSVAACYLGMNAACLYVLPIHQVIASTRVAAEAASAVAGPRGAAVMSALVLISAFGGVNGVILAGPRVYYAMAQDGLAFRWLGAVHPKFHTPHVAILAQAGWAIVLVATGTYRQLFTRVVFTEWGFFALMTIGLFVLRGRPGCTPRYRVWGYPVLPVAFIVASVLVLFYQIVADPRGSLTGLILVLAGLPIYWLWARASARDGDRTSAHH
jgi:APA family basic amino acid/polyamine antiporter